MSANNFEKVKVNEVEVDFVALKLLIDERWKNIEARQLNLLKLFIEHRGQAVSRNQIMDALWHQTIVSDNSVSQAVTQLRKSLNDDKDTPRFIKTVPRVGYQLIADVEFVSEVEDKTEHPKKKQLNYLSVSVISAFVAIICTVLFFQLADPELELPLYQYESRLTSVPGPENFLRYSPNGRYLAFSQMASNRKHADIAVYDSKNQSIYSIKHTGYNEEAAEWSPDNNWLIYYRHDPISCEIRVMSVANPVETWRMSPDYHLADCQPGARRSKMHWLNNNQLFIVDHQNNEPNLVKLSLVLNNIPKVDKRESIKGYSPILLDIHKNGQQMLIVEQLKHKYQLTHVNLANDQSKVIETSDQPYWGLKWHNNSNNFWLGNQQLKLMSLNGESKTVNLPLGFIPDLDINPVTEQLAHAEGRINVNLYSATLKALTEQHNLTSQQISSSTRTDILPTLSNDGTQIAFISYQQRSADGLKHIEIWLKNKFKKTASLLVNLSEGILPQLILWSPSNNNLLLLDKNNKVYLVNVFAKHLTPILIDYEDIKNIRWSANGKDIYFTSFNGNKFVDWRYNLQLKTTEIDNDSDVINNIDDHLTVKRLQNINPSFDNYLVSIERFLLQETSNQLPIDNISHSLAIYRPYVFKKGIYYVLKQGKSLALYLFTFKQKQNIKIANLGRYEQDINFSLNISSSDDGKQVVYSLVQGLETDILVQQKVEPK